ncbi:MAG: hypothetical protein U9R49_13335, partial [Bacteroidota bacterium]|nr:hypothetical protein [Bacteroidota bacterium]
MRLFGPYHWAATLILALLLFSCEREEPDNRTLEEKLNDLPGVTAVSIDPVYGYPEQFRLEITQAADHNHPGGPTFV